MYTFKPTTVGSSEGFIVPKDARDKLNIQKGDILYLTDAPDGGLRITPFNPDFARQMTLAEQIMREDREILRVPSK